MKENPPSPKPYSILVAFVGAYLSLAAFPASAQTADTTPGTTTNAVPNSPAKPDPSSDTLHLDEFVVTGSGVEIRKFDSAFSISTMSDEKIQQLAPHSAADLVRNLPGFSSEPSGGESGNNVAVRGLPSSNFRFVGFLEDGLPNFQEQQQDFINADELLRVDATIAGVEAVRGGTASIYTSNSPGAVVNFITKKGTETPKASANSR